MKYCGTLTHIYFNTSLPNVFHFYCTWTWISKHFTETYIIYQLSLGISPEHVIPFNSGLEPNWINPWNRMQIQGDIHQSGKWVNFFLLKFWCLGFGPSTKGLAVYSITNYNEPTRTNMCNNVVLLVDIALHSTLADNEPCGCNLQFNNIGTNFIKQECLQNISSNLQYDCICIIIEWYLQTDTNIITFSTLKNGINIPIPASSYKLHLHKWRCNYVIKNSNFINAKI